MAIRLVHDNGRAMRMQLKVLNRFFERIAKTYRKEHWGSMLRPLLTTWYSCAKQLGHVELSIRLLLEMIGHGMCLIWYGGSVI